MAKRAPLFAVKASEVEAPAAAPEMAAVQPGEEVSTEARISRRPPSREDKRAVTIYVNKVAWKQLRQLAVDQDKPQQALGEEALNLLFQHYGVNRSA